LAAETANAAYSLQTRARKGAFGVRQLAAALQLGLMQIIANNWAIHKGASKLAHSKGFASDKKYAALAETAALPGRPSTKSMQR
jgi:hypothetical protein